MFRCRRCRCRDLQFPGTVQLRVTLKLNLPHFPNGAPLALLGSGPSEDSVRTLALERRPPGPVRFGESPESGGPPNSDTNAEPAENDAINLQRTLNESIQPEIVTENSPENVL